jgi:EpsI family protein
LLVTFFLDTMIDNAVTPRRISFRFSNLTILRWAKWLAIVLLFALFYGRVVAELVADWYRYETFSYGFLVPFIAAYLVWQSRDRLKLISPKPSFWAAFPLLIALLLGLIGQAIGDVFSTRVSMIMALASTVYLLLGREFFKPLWFPLLYLMLMIPPPYVLIKNLTYHLRYLDAAHGANILEFLGIPVFVEAYFIHLPNMTLEVADVCSGMSSVFALFALGTVYAYFLPIRASLKVFLAVCTFPFAMAANLIRIVVIAVLAYNLGAIVFQSTFHWLTGTTVFLLALLMLISTGELLRRKFSLTVVRDAGRNEIAADFDSRDTSVVSSWLPHGLCIFVFTATLILANSLGNGQKMHLNSDLRLLVSPETHGLVQSKFPDLYQDANADEALSVVTTLQDENPIEVFVGYRGEQAGGIRLGSPKINFPEHWNSVWLKPANVEVAGDTSIRGTWMLTRKGNSARLVIYWYQIAEDTFSGEFENRIRQLQRAFLERRTDGAVVRIATPLLDGESVEQAQERLRLLSVQLYSRLTKILPA